MGAERRDGSSQLDRPLQPVQMSAKESSLARIETAITFYTAAKHMLNFTHVFKLRNALNCFAGQGQAQPRAVLLWGHRVSHSQKLLNTGNT